MSEKKSFKLNGAIVKLNGMPMNMAEQAVDFALEALKDNNTEKVCVLQLCRGIANPLCCLLLSRTTSSTSS